MNRDECIKELGKVLERYFQAPEFVSDYTEISETVLEIVESFFDDIEN